MHTVPQNVKKTPCSLIRVLADHPTLANVKACIKQGGSIYERSTLSFDLVRVTPVHVASKISAETGDASILEYLLSITPPERLKAVVNARDASFKIPLHHAIDATGFSGSTAAAIEILVAAGANIDARDNDGVTPLFLATIYMNQVAMKALIRLGADVNIPRTLRNSTPLHMAI